MSKSNDALRKAAFRGYTVLADGSVVGPRGSPLSLQRVPSGHLRFNVSLGNDRYPVFVHRLVAFNKYGEDALKERVEVRHLNGIPTDNRAENIGIGSHSDNLMDQPAAVRVRRAKHASVSLRKLSDKQVSEMRSDRAKGALYRELCAEYGVSKSTVSYIVRGLCRTDAT